MAKFKDIWDRSKDGTKQEQRSFIRVALVATAVFLIFMMVKKDNVFRWIDAAVTINRQEKTIRENEATLQAMDQRIHDLKTNRDTLEAFARENLHFSQPGDDVYLTPENQ